MGGNAAIFILVLGGSVNVPFAVQRSRFWDEADRQRDMAQGVKEFLEMDLLPYANPSKQGRVISLREVVDRACESTVERFPDQPMVAAAMAAG